MSRLGRHLRPEELLHQLGVTEPDHIDLEAIAHLCGAQIRYRPLRGCEARLIGTDDEAIISVNNSCSDGRQRFSAAHELGHWNCDTKAVGLRCSADQIGTVIDSLPDQERAANAYAAGLLLPSFLLTPRLPRTGYLSWERVGEVASEFRTSMTATVIRACRLGMLPTMVAAYRKDGRTTFARSPNWPDRVFLANEIHHDTNVFELIYGNSLRQAVDERTGIQVRELLDGDTRKIGAVHVEGLRVAKDTVVVVGTLPEA